MIVNRKMAEAARATLGMEPELDTATEACVQLAFRQAARTAHPDAGGSSEAFAAADRAKHVLLRWLERSERSTPLPEPKPDCARCHGKGFILSHRAWKTLRIQCPRCRGTGDETAEHEKGDYR